MNLVPTLMLSHELKLVISTFCEKQYFRICSKPYCKILCHPLEKNLNILRKMETQFCKYHFHFEIRFTLAQCLYIQTETKFCFFFHYSYFYCKNHGKTYFFFIYHNGLSHGTCPIYSTPDKIAWEQMVISSPLRKRFLTWKWKPCR